MKANIHPQYQTTTIVCNSCGNSFISGSTLDEIRVEICYNCHPHYTGKAKIVDTENLVKKFEIRSKQVDRDRVNQKKQKQAERNKKSVEVKSKDALTLKDMLKQLG